MIRSTTLIALAAFSASAFAQCTVEIPANAVVVTTDTSFSAISQSVWVCNGGSVNGGSVDPIFFVESGGYLSLSGLNKKVYLQAGATIECSGIGDTIWYETGATINCSGDHVDILCTDLVFDLTDAPANGCVGSTADIGALEPPSFSVTFDPSLHQLRADLPSAGPWQIDLFDPMGRGVSTEHVTGRTALLNIPTTAAAVLLVRLRGPSGSFVERFVVP